jgi:hypothetical protein
MTERSVKRTATVIAILLIARFYTVRRTARTSTESGDSRIILICHKLLPGNMPGTPVTADSNLG